MYSNVNSYNQPIGNEMPNWMVRAHPPRKTITGRYCHLEPLEANRHANDLFESFNKTLDGRDWTYMFEGPFTDLESYRIHAEKAELSNDPLHFAVIDVESGRAVGSLALMRIDHANGSVEIGHVVHSDFLKRTRAATEAHYLLMRLVFEELGYRRYEWNCDSLNLPSRSAALRLGFKFEGIFRHAVVYNARSRDTAWFSIIDSEWPAVRQGLEKWLDEGNFDSKGCQRKSLKEFIPGQ
jgi:RimJ/RimL family protein N-acetyltransferase